MNKAKIAMAAEKRHHSPFSPLVASSTSRSGTSSDSSPTLVLGPYPLVGKDARGDQEGQDRGDPRPPQKAEIYKGGRAIRGEIQEGPLRRYRLLRPNEMHTERIKSERHIKKIRKQLAACKEEEKAALQSQLQTYEDNLLYITHFPRSEKYLSIYAKDCDLYKEQRAAILAKIKERVKQKEEQLKADIKEENALNAPAKQQEEDLDDEFFLSDKPKAQKRAAPASSSVSEAKPKVKDENEPEAVPIVRSKPKPVPAPVQKPKVQRITKERSRWRRRRLSSGSPSLSRRRSRLRRRRLRRQRLRPWRYDGPKQHAMKIEGQAQESGGAARRAGRGEADRVRLGPEEAQKDRAR